MKKVSIVLIISYIGLALYQLLQWFQCKQLNGTFHFESNSYVQHIDEYIHSDKEIPILWIRIIHNKVTVLIPDIVHIYLRFWDLHFLIFFLTLLGVVGVAFGFWYILEQKQKIIVWIVIAVILLLPFVEVLFYQYISYNMQFLLLWLPLQVFSVFGISCFLWRKRIKGILIVGGLLLLSILWMLSFGSQMLIYCIKL